MNKQDLREEPVGSLKKVLGFWSLLAVGIGSVAAQSSFVSLLNGAGVGGGSFFVAIFVAFLLTLCYCFSFLELSLMMPKAGGLGTYTSVASGNFISIGVVLGGYIAVMPFNGPAELMLLERIVDTVYPGSFSHLGLMVLVLFTVLNFFGINIFASVQNVLVYILLVALLVIGVTGFYGIEAKGIDVNVIGRQLAGSGLSLISLLALALWSFAGLEYMCPLIEESRNPVRDLPRAMLVATGLLLLVYGLIAFGGMRHVQADLLKTSELPHWLLVESMFGQSAGFVMVVFAVTATSSVANTIIASLPRVLFGMALRGQVPRVFGRLHSRWGTPWVGIIFISSIIGIPLMMLANKKDLILLLLLSAVTFWLVAYMVAHVVVILLRRKYPHQKRPFKTPLYPLPQVLGILAMGYAIWYNSPSPEISRQVYLNSGLMFVVISVYAFFWVKYKMKKGLMEAEPMEEIISS
ncbi:MAG TPA: APC family permease [Chitinophagaceae bacterium]|nr:APC family permease [Chitinophagaceae bacterium]